MEIWKTAPALGMLGDVQGVIDIVLAAPRGERYSGLVVLKAMNTAPPQAIPIFLDALRNDEDSALAASALAAMDVKEALPILLSLLDQDGVDDEPLVSLCRLAAGASPAIFD